MITLYLIGLPAVQELQKCKQSHERRPGEGHCPEDQVCEVFGRCNAVLIFGGKGQITLKRVFKCLSNGEVELSVWDQADWLSGRDITADHDEGPRLVDRRPTKARDRGGHRGNCAVPSI
ncbi:hypothetical protein [Sinorhizobium sp. CCBAU 05631]|uniref:hypothetical protein n=1 Tax=Sinorhizobium sp. CCBAU 05631 TaxID=794846 RepID=UPI0012FA0FFB|nr:hypothetical protein [Sinorhizobium sp. CCBAU 05631]